VTVSLVCEDANGLDFRWGWLAVLLLRLGPCTLHIRGRVEFMGSMCELWFGEWQILSLALNIVTLHSVGLDCDALFGGCAKGLPKSGREYYVFFAVYTRVRSNS
jgi:hypothetical protein